jgi:hypothetical protein
MTRVTDSLNVFFDEDGVVLATGLQLVLDTTFGTFGIGRRRARLYPGIREAKIVTNIGTVTKRSIHVQTVDREVLQFSGGQSSNGQFPILDLTDVTIFGSTFDVEGNDISPSFFAKDGQLQSTEPVYGAVEISYNTTYLELDYEGETTTITGNIGAGQQTFLGTILAFHEGAVATLALDPSDFVGDEGTEIYRVISEAVANADGLWEKPVGWTGRPGSPTHPDGEPDGAQGNQLIERVHEQGFVTARNSIFVRSQNIPFAQPFETSRSFTRVFKIRVNTVGTNQGDLTEEQADSAQVESAIESAKTRFNI